MSIAPTEIHITKDSFNYQWQTLRTSTSQKTKSGHSTVTIEFTVPFVGFEEVSDKLRPLIAQLRYMPFCFVENQFLRANLFPQEIQGGIDQDTFQTGSTIVLAMRAISVSTRSDTPDTLWATFQFAYFNYLPYTPFWQYKKDLFGPESNIAVTFPSESKAWTKFMAPVVKIKGSPSKVPAGQASLQFLELRTAPISSVESLKKTQEIVKAIAANQDPFFSSLRNNVSDTPEKTIIDALRSSFSQYQDTTDLAAADIVAPLLLNAGPRSNPSSVRFRGDKQYIDQNALKQVLSEIDQRILSKQQVVEEFTDSDFTLIKGLDFQDNRGQGYGIFKRIRELNLSADQDIIITGITISIQNILATIPIIGHRYATFQHIGSIDASVNLDIKVTSDEGMRRLAWFYDTVNENMIVNRHIPQGLQTIRLSNDILSLFNLSEFITQDFASSTIPGQPGTYDVKLSLIESGLKQKDKIDQPPNEKFKVEFAASDERVTREIVRILNEHVATKTRGNFPYFDTNVKDPKAARFSNIVDNYVGKFNFPTSFLESTPVGNAFSIAKKRGFKQFVKDALGIENPNNPAPRATDNNFPVLTNPIAGGPIDVRAIADIASNGFKSRVTNLNSFTRAIEDDIAGSETLLFRTLFGLTEEDVPGITKVQQMIYARAKLKKELNIGIGGLVNKPLSQLLSEARAQTARGSQVISIKQKKQIYTQVNFSPDDLSAINRLTGISNELPQTPQEEAFIDQLKGSVDTLLARKPFVQWFEVLANLTRLIIDGDDIELSEFATVKRMVKDLGLSRGLPAYPDFELEKILESNGDFDIDTLLSLDPDCFLLSPTEASIDDFIDPALIANAKRIARTSFDSSLNQINRHYQDSWLPSFISDTLRDRIKQNIQTTIKEHGTDATVSASAYRDPVTSFYKESAKGTFINAGARNTGENPIQVGGTDIDPGQTHSSTSIKQQLSSQRVLRHSLNPMDLFEDGVGNAAQGTSTKRIARTGKHLPAVTNTQLNSSGIIDDDPNKLATQAGVSLEVYALARMIASEEGGSPRAHKVAVGWAAVNEASIRGRSVAALLMTSIHGNNLFAAQTTGRYAATGRDPHTDDVGIAAGILSGSIPDTTGGASRFFSPKTQDFIIAKLRNAQEIGDLQTVERLKKYKKTSAMVQADWIKSGLMPVEVAGVDSSELMLFKKTRGKVAARTYTPPSTPSPLPSSTASPSSSIRNPDSGLGAGLNVADMSIEAFQNSMKNGQGMRLVRAFPAFKLYFIQDDSNNRRRFGLDDFFSYNSVVDITCVRSRKIPADLLEITLTNVSGVLSNRKFQGPRTVDGFTGWDVSSAPIGADGKGLQQDPKGFLKRDTKKENPLASLMLQPGIDMELRLGYSNDADKLTTVFDGKIMEVEFSDSDDLVRIICQSHAIELVQDMKGMAEPKEQSGYFINDARTDRLLESMMAEPELVHFGRWFRSKSTDNNSNTNRSLLTNKFSLQPSPQDDNIFVPKIEDLKRLDPGWLFNDLSYYIYHTTIWDIFDEMTLRHPGWIKSAVPYKGKFGPRMTMFFGLPSQLYFSADPSSEERSAGSKLRNQVDQYNSTIDELSKSYVYSPNLVVQTSEVETRLIAAGALPKPQAPKPFTNNRLKSKLQTRDFAAERLALAKDFQSIKPFRSYHLVTAKNHIISNNIRASAKNTFNTVSIQYGKSTWNKSAGQLVQEGNDVFTLSIDAALPDEEVREMFAQYKNCQSELIAKNYALASLMRELRDVYRGELTIIGNPEIKPYDIVYIFDDYSDLMGPVEVEQVIHKFSQDTGFITEITPDLFVTANEWVNMTASDMMSIIIEGTAGHLTHGTSTATDTVTSSATGRAAAVGAFAVGLGLSPLAAIIGAGLAIGGNFMLQKMVDFTAHGQPVVMHPLIHRGKPLIAGLPLAKLNNLWSTNKGEWLHQALEGTDLLFDDINDKLVLAPSQGSLFNLFDGDKIGPKF